jgi:hypothetical protein
MANIALTVIVPRIENLAVYQGGTTLKGGRNFSVAPPIAELDPTEPSNNNSWLNYTLAPHNALYIRLLYPENGGNEPFEPEASELSQLTEALAGMRGEDDPTKFESTLPYFCYGCDNGTISDGIPTSASKPTIAPNITLYVPYVSDPTIIKPRVTEMQSVASALLNPTSTDKNETENTGCPDPSGTDPDKPDPTETDSGEQADCTNSGKLGASVAGGVVGGFFAGVAIGILILWLLRRRRRQTHATSGSTMRDELISSHSPGGKEMQNLAIPMSVTGWQKHLPQEKDDGTIARTVKSIFDQVQVHMEGFYKARPRKMNGEAVAAIEGVSSADLAKKLSKAPNGVLMLEAILIRWIVHRMSLRSVAAESFLPIEYTKIPEQNGWHMESDEHGNGHAAEAKKGRSQSATHILSHLY